MFTIDGKQREAGLGPVGLVPIATARKRAAEWRELLAKGEDPLAAKRAANEAKAAAKAAEAARRTFGEVALDLIEAKRKSWRWIYMYANGDPSKSTPR
jgi:hypothetical protein